MNKVVTGLMNGRVQGKNLSATHIGANPDTFKLELVIDEDTIKHNGTSYYVDLTALKVVSVDEDNLLVAGSDNGAMLVKDTVKALVGEMVADLNDGIDYGAAQKVLVAKLKAITEVDSDTIDMTVTDTDGNISIKADIKISTDKENKLTLGSDGGLLVKPVETIGISVNTVDTVTDPLNVFLTINIEVDGVSATANVPLEPEYNLAGVIIGYQIKSE